MPFIWVGEGAPIPRVPAIVDPAERVAPMKSSGGSRPVGDQDPEHPPRAGPPEQEAPFRPGQEAYRHAEERREERERKPAVLARQIMISPVTMLPPDASIAEAREIMKDREFHHIPIVDVDRKPIGIISDRDILRGKPHPDHRVTRRLPEGPPVTVRDLMSTRLLTATAETEIREIARVMVREKIGCLPIVDNAHNLIGILTSTDVLQCVVNNAPLELWM